MNENLNPETPKPAKLKNCIVCKEELFSVFAATFTEDNQTQPQGGVSFRGSGAYGSGFDYDPNYTPYDESPEFVINICDECLTTAIKAEEVLVHTKEVKVVHNYKNAKLT